MDTRSHDVMNRLTQIGGAGSIVVEGQINEFATVTVNSQPPNRNCYTPGAHGAYRFRRTVPVSQGSNTVNITATDQDSQVTSQNWQFTVPAR